MVYVYGIVCPDTATEWRRHVHHLVNIERKNGERNAAVVYSMYNEEKDHCSRACP
jgi:predicted secreted protein